jgi:hypothetical protein
VSTEPDALRLRLMVRAFRAAKPSDEEVEAGVRRVLRGLKRAQQRRRSRLLPIVVVAILGLGTLAYARPSGFASVLSTLLDAAQSAREPSGQGAPRSMSAPVQVEEPARRASAPRAEPPAEPEPLAELGELQADVTSPSEPEPAPSSARPREKAPSNGETSAPSASWSAVKQALDANDTERALAALEKLGESESPETRAKAAFGTAQLLWAKGYKAKACAIAESLSSAPRTDARTRERAGALVANCKR